MLHAANKLDEPNSDRRRFTNCDLQTKPAADRWCGLVVTTSCKGSDVAAALLLIVCACDVVREGCGRVKMQGARGRESLQIYCSPAKQKPRILGSSSWIFSTITNAFENQASSTHAQPTFSSSTPSRLLYIFTVSLRA